MKKISKTTTKIICATCVTIFSLLAVFSGTFTWFTAKRALTLKDDPSFGVVRTETSIHSIKFFPYLGRTTSDPDATNQYFGFDPNPSCTIGVDNGTASITQGTANFTLGKFYITDPHHPLLMLVEVDGPDAIIELETESTYITNGPLAAVNNKLSSVIQTSYVTFASLPTASNKDLYTYDNQGNISSTTTSTSCISVLKDDLEGEQSFAKFDAKGNLSSFDPTICIFNGVEVSGTYSYVGIVFDYYNIALQDIFSYFLGDPILDEGVSFTCDWSTYL